MASRIIPLSVDGMHCASCVRRVERALRRVEGVQLASVNLATGKAYVTCQAPATEDELVNTVRKTGFSAQPITRVTGSDAHEADPLSRSPRLIRFVAAVVRQWEPRSFSDRIEAAVGADLQYIRMNGTIVGGLVGGALYLLSLLAR